MVQKFQLLSAIAGNEEYDRVLTPHQGAGIYFWGFTLAKDQEGKPILPTNAEELLICYIGKSSRNVIERMMQEITQLVFGGFGPILHYQWLSHNPFSANFSYKGFGRKILSSKKNNSQKVSLADQFFLGNVLQYNPKGLHSLYEFYQTDQPVEALRANHAGLKKTLEWMRERLLFTWIPVAPGMTPDEIAYFESIFHHLVKLNVLGIDKINKYFNHYTLPDLTQLIQSGLANLTYDEFKKLNLASFKHVPAVKFNLLKAACLAFHHLNWQNCRPLEEWLKSVNTNLTAVRQVQQAFRAAYKGKKRKAKIQTFKNRPELTAIFSRMGIFDEKHIPVLIDTLVAAWDEGEYIPHPDMLGAYKKIINEPI